MKIFKKKEKKEKKEKKNCITCKFNYGLGCEVGSFYDKKVICYNGELWERK